MLPELLFKHCCPFIPETAIMPWLISSFNTEPGGD